MPEVYCLFIWHQYKVPFVIGCLFEHYDLMCSLISFAKHWCNLPEPDSFISFDSFHEFESYLHKYKEYWSLNNFSSPTCFLYPEGGAAFVHCDFDNEDKGFTFLWNILRPNGFNWYSFYPFDSTYCRELLSDKSKMKRNHQYLRAVVGSLFLNVFKEEGFRCNV